jgi:hypothetical protein
VSARNTASNKKIIHNNYYLKRYVNWNYYDSPLKTVEEKTASEATQRDIQNNEHSISTHATLRSAVIQNRHTDDDDTERE